ncbi:MAG: DsbA family protein [Gemmatimonadota bacterium]
MKIPPLVRLALPAVVFVALVAAPRGWGPSEEAPDPAPVVQTDAEPLPEVPLAELYHQLGSPDATVTVVEFSDFGCPYCALFARETFPALKKEFVDGGGVVWRMVPFALGIFPNGAEALRAAACVAEQDEDTFWRIHDILFRRQEEWKGGRDVASLFRDYAAEVGADPVLFDECYPSRRARERVAASQALAHRMGVRSTPSFFVNGQLIQGAIPLEDFRRILRAALAGEG